MRRRDLSFERVVATTVWLLDHTLIRVGNAEYANDSYGLTTLLDEHVDVSPATLHFRFVGKSGKPHDVVLSDRRVARIVAKCQELPGQQLLQYVVDDDVRGLGSRDVNDYIRDVDPLRLHGQDVPNLGRQRLRPRPAARVRAASSDTEAKIQTARGDQGHRRGAAQHGNRVPAELRPSGGPRGARRRQPAPATRPKGTRGQSDECRRGAPDVVAGSRLDSR